MSAISTPAPANRLLAQAYRGLGRLAEAWALYRALPFGPDDLDEVYSLHEALEAAGESTSATAVLESIYGIQADYRDVARKLDVRGRSSSPLLKKDPERFVLLRVKFFNQMTAVP